MLFNQYQIKKNKKKQDWAETMINKRKHVTEIHNGKVPVPYSSMLHIPPTNYHLLAARTRAMRAEAYLIKKKKRRSRRRRIFRKKRKVRRLGHYQKRTRQKEQRDSVEGKEGDRKVESNDSHEIPDRGTGRGKGGGGHQTFSASFRGCYCRTDLRKLNFV